MITHKAIAGGWNGVASDDGRVIGCYECFDAANRAALNYVRRAERGCVFYAAVVTVTGACVVEYHGNKEGTAATTGPAEPEMRKAAGWDTPEKERT